MTRQAAHICDVLVVGGGGAGLAAALAAARAGAAVILIEKNPHLGGTTAMAVGSITAAGTRHQKRAGIDDDADRYFADLDRYDLPAGATDNRELRRLLADNIADTVAWLEGLGIVFSGPAPEPPHTRPRMHNVLPNARAYIHNLARHCRRAGVDIRTGCQAVELLADSVGRVTGVRVKGDDGGIADIAARRGVVLAAGDYSAAEDLRGDFLPPRTAGIGAINPTNTGDGHRLALALGAEIANAHLFMGPVIRFPPPQREPLVQRLAPTPAMGRFVKLAMTMLPRALLRPVIVMYMTAAMEPSAKLFAAGAALVNRRGERFGEEASESAFAFAGQPGGEGFVLFDEKLAQKFSAWPDFISTAPGIAYAYVADYRRYRADIFHQGRDASALARASGLPADALARSIEDAGFSGPPYYALGPARAWIMTTDGGLKVTRNLEVIGAQGTAIPGLFAAGATGQGGLQIPGHGQHLGWAFTSGRLAGRNAALK